MDLKDYTEANRRSWNEVAKLHHAAKEEHKKKFQLEGYSVLDALVTGKLKQYDIEGKEIAHLCCNDGMETLSLANLGTAACTGFDISDRAIEEAQRLADATGIRCEFVRTDVYDIPIEYDGQFDLVYMSAGSLIWFPDLTLLFQKVKRLLRGKGVLFIYDIHPVLFMLDEKDKKHPLSIRYSYFLNEPRKYTEGLDYINNVTYESEPYYVFDPTLSEIITAVIKSGLQLQQFEEFDHDISALYEHLDHEEIRLPKSYILAAGNTSATAAMKGE
ncbi:class I SAM-dependent methyltransferase [Fictibacillus fluitans]|uniref:Class I SAM-dependent methyltransferase n=1 Tax=Fictibacillus fluitans TaxID=3058422 RepID=A0ABT8HTI2_9BACL|nr:class I SAM-dependent methyltransferase [Fictibacillus sp. NE201]MDN4524088.1 class I SAM-dependent methyltransferase [Fictibacillus sp. NE201]